MNKNKNVQAIVQKTSVEADKFKKITEKNWTVYYFLLSISSKNYAEDHRYTYRDEFNITQVSKDLGINRQTFYNSLKVLEKEHLISICDKYILIDVPENYITISKELLI